MAGPDDFGALEPRHGESGSSRAPPRRFRNRRPEPVASRGAALPSETSCPRTQPASADLEGLGPGLGTGASSRPACEPPEEPPLGAPTTSRTPGPDAPGCGGRDRACAEGKGDSSCNSAGAPGVTAVTGVEGGAPDVAAAEQRRGGRSGAREVGRWWMQPAQRAPAFHTRSRQRCPAR